MRARTAKLAEIPAIVELWQEFMREHDAILFEERPEWKARMKRKREAPRLFADSIRKRIHSRNGTVIVAEESNELVGYGVISLRKDPPVYVENTNAYISDLFVVKAWRGRGVSSKLKEELLAWARRKGERNISLNVFLANRHARSIYERWGFQGVTAEMRR